MSTTDTSTETPAGIMPLDWHVYGTEEDPNNGPVILSEALEHLPGECEPDDH